MIRLRSHAITLLTLHLPQCQFSKCDGLQFYVSSYGTSFTERKVLRESVAFRYHLRSGEMLCSVCTHMPIECVYGKTPNLMHVSPMLHVQIVGRRRWRWPKRQGGWLKIWWQPIWRV